MLSGKQVLVTGAGGFIASHLVERLVADGAQVRAFVRYNSRGDWGLLKLLPGSSPALRKSRWLEVYLQVGQCQKW